MCDKIGDTRWAARTREVRPMRDIAILRSANRCPSKTRRHDCHDLQSCLLDGRPSRPSPPRREPPRQTRAAPRTGPTGGPAGTTGNDHARRRKPDPTGARFRKPNPSAHLDGRDPDAIAGNPPPTPRPAHQSTSPNAISEPSCAAHETFTDRLDWNPQTPLSGRRARIIETPELG